MLVTRLAKRQYADLTGTGAAIVGGRWNSPGKAVVYTASCAALAALEYLVHLKTMPVGLMLMTIEVPDTLEIERVHAVPADPAAFVQIGNDWLTNSAKPILEVPSVIVPRQKNYLLNPAHPLMPAIRLIEINPFAFDSRLLSYIP